MSYRMESLKEHLKTVFHMPDDVAARAAAGRDGDIEETLSVNEEIRKIREDGAARRAAQAEAEEAATPEGRARRHFCAFFGMSEDVAAVAVAGRRSSDSASSPL